MNNATKTANSTGQGVPTHLPGIRGPILVASLITIVALAGSLGWAGTAPIDRGVLGRGKIAGTLDTQTVQHLDGGIIKKILVHEGQRVDSGETLLLLDSKEDALHLDALENQLATLQARAARLAALRSGAEELIFPDELMEHASTSADIREKLHAQQRLFAAERRTAEETLTILQRRVEKQEALIQSLKERDQSHRQELALVEKEIEGLASLVKKGYAPKARLVDLQRQRTNINSTRADVLGQIAQAESATNEIASQIAAFRYRNAERWSKEANELEERREALVVEMESAKQRVDRSSVHSPVAGTIMNMRFVTEGGVIGGGEPIMEIVPISALSQVDLRIEPRDIEDIQFGQLARIRLSGLPQRNTPLIDGTVVRISPDTVIDERTGRAFYNVRVEMDQDDLKALDLADRLQPGMPVEVVVVSTQTTPLAAVLKPLSDVLFRSLR